MSDTATILDHPIVSSRYFYPRPATLTDPFWVQAADGSQAARRGVYAHVDTAS